MSEVKHARVCHPPAFPLEGRLPRRALQVHQNLHRQRQQERDYHDALCLAAGRRVMLPCCKTLHISLFFDGTGNNLNHDLYVAVPPHPTNIARLFRATIGDGHAGGTSHTGSKAQRLTDAAGTGYGQYYKYYMPGVGTPFAEVGDLDYSFLGLGGAWYGEERISWGLLMIIDALRRALGLPRLDDASLQASVKAMGSLPGLEWASAFGNRYREFNKQFAAIAKPLRIALSQPQPGMSKLLGVRLYVYGFSRGAAAARAFVSGLNQLLSREASTPALTLMDLTLPVSVEYLGLLDTVASVGIADIMPEANGHMSWADGNQQLPAGELVKRCLHLVASHEQRLCFPLESIRRESGEYPVNSEEVIYPGVHSDQGGGYPPGDQGKAIGRDDRLLLSQIALHDLYSDAFAHGAPLKVPPISLPIELSQQLWRAMESEVEIEFGVSPELAHRFNAWRHVTLGLPPATQPLPVEQVERYHPIPATDTLEQAVRDQLAWITAWRIDRYAFASLLETPFYLQASDTQADEAVRNKDEQERDKIQAAVETRRKQQLARERIPGTPKTPLEPGPKDFDADMAQTQLREAAEEFSADYRSIGVQPSPAMRVARLVIFPMLLPSVITAVVRVEREQMKAAGQLKVSQLFPPPLYERNHLNENYRGNVEESRNATQPEGLLRALFDDQVHDSRAWFLYKRFRREPFGSYFGERMVFFGDVGRRDLALYGENDAATLADATPRPATDTARTQQPPLTDPERLAQVHQAIDAIWEDFYAKVGEMNDGKA
ncbi:T6SS phospholipase effector Tle1-like catalytic domain-containing protein [Pseudomonas sp. 18173]|uniref:T6SS phospholipase effector Tle1-like catalytic domain-containing protein n=1 Tax=Pseudomonas sp. 18173 TaxID=3390055 RepID=UPI003D25C482